MHPDFTTGATRNTRSATSRGQTSFHQAAIWQKWWQRASTLRQVPTLARSKEFADRVLSQEADLRGATADAFAHRVRQLRGALAYHGVTEALAADAFALVREVTSRRLGLAQHAGQIIAARIMLDNQLAEMAPGEGKTLAIALAAATVALAGMPVHVIINDDHLTVRDRDLLMPVYEALGLTVGCVVEASGVDDRRFEYSSDVTYCSARELVVDYLRDCLLLGADQPEPDGPAAQSRARAQRASRLLLRGLGMAILDDADRVLLDDVSAPLILSQRKTDRSRIGYFWQARLIADGCTNHQDFEMNADERSIVLTGSGMRRLDLMAKKLGGQWKKPEQRERLIGLALAAKYLYHRDFDYVVRNARVLAIDPDSGRVCGPSIWPRGLQQLIELKESCEITGDKYIGAQTTYAAFFSRFLRVAGTGSALREARDELTKTYALHVMQVPRRNPSKHVRVPLRVFASRSAHRATIVARVRALHESGCAVLVRTASIAESEHISLWLTYSKLRHVVLHGHDAGKDSRLLARAGRPGHITIVTQSAGRGIDIPLTEATATAGGLHLISCYADADVRGTRAGEGWCARRGELGTVETILCLQHYPLCRAVSPWMATALRLLFRRHALPNWLGQILLLQAQRGAEREKKARRLSVRSPKISSEIPFVVTPSQR